MTFETLILKRIIPEIFSRPFMQPLNQLMFRIAISGMGVNNWDGSSRDEQRLLGKLARRLAEDTTILDVGANVGQYATLARKYFPRANIFSFEPNPAAFAKLLQLADELKIEAIPLGCGSSVGQMPMFDFSESSGSEIATLVPGVLETIGVQPMRFEVDLTTIDSFCNERNITEVGLLKVDVEGFERQVLMGASGMLSAGRVEVVQFEFNEGTLLNYTRMEDLQRQLAGYTLHRLLYDGSLLPIEPMPGVRKNLFCYQNIVALRNPPQLPQETL